MSNKITADEEMCLFGGGPHNSSALRVAMAHCKQIFNSVFVHRIALHKGYRQTAKAINCS